MIMNLPPKAKKATMLAWISFLHLPHALQEHVFSFIDKDDRPIAALVCRTLHLLRTRAIARFQAAVRFDAAADATQIRSLYRCREAIQELHFMAMPANNMAALLSIGAGQFHNLTRIVLTGRAVFTLEAAEALVAGTSKLSCLSMEFPKCRVRSAEAGKLLAGEQLPCQDAVCHAESTIVFAGHTDKLQIALKEDCNDLLCEISPGMEALVSSASYLSVALSLDKHIDHFISANLPFLDNPYSRFHPKGTMCFVLFLQRFHTRITMLELVDSDHDWFGGLYACFFCGMFSKLDTIKCDIFGEQTTPDHHRLLNYHYQIPIESGANIILPLSLTTIQAPCIMETCFSIPQLANVNWKTDTCPWIVTHTDGLAASDVIARMVRSTQLNEVSCSPSYSFFRVFVNIHTCRSAFDLSRAVTTTLLA